MPLYTEARPPAPLRPLLSSLRQPCGDLALLFPGPGAPITGTEGSDVSSDSESCSSTPPGPGHHSKERTQPECHGPGSVPLPPVPGPRARHGACCCHLLHVMCVTRPVVHIRPLWPAAGPGPQAGGRRARAARPSPWKWPVAARAVWHSARRAQAGCTDNERHGSAVPMLRIRSGTPGQCRVIQPRRPDLARSYYRHYWGALCQ